MTRWLVLVIGVLSLIGCAGSHQTAENSELQNWVGTWQGMALRENRAEPPRQWTLVLSLKNGRLLGVMSDDAGEMRRLRLDDLRVTNSVLQFSVTYETSRGLQVVFRHRARLMEDKLLSVFVGREGGRPFDGKWEAQRISAAEAAAQ